ncbi:MAG: glutamate-1-semialdehyde 2,1-aminomutase [Planctomycetes bacterium]|nr:glutamate-1-semialdehyde 2,1-aminomutase [Planctomycetota bacterium]
MERSARLFENAKRRIPGGVNSPVRAFGPVGGVPPFIASANGCRITDVDGRVYVDYVGSWGPMILGHAHPAVLAALRETIERGTSFGAPTEAEVDLAELICERVPSAEMVRLVSSGTEATMTALRIARGATGRDAIVKFEGCYHGHADSFLVAAGSGAATHGHPSSPGVPASLAALTLTAPFNDLGAVAEIFARSGKEIAAVIVEPVAGNMGCVPPQPGFLEGLRALTKEYGALLIFDEVMTGFRVHPRSAQGLYGIDPDLTTLGKIIGGGLPIGAVAGKRPLLEQLAPVGPIYQAGTLSGNPLSVAAGLATLRTLRDQEETIYGKLEELTRSLVTQVGAALRDRAVPHQVQRVGSMFAIYFTDALVHNFADAKRSDANLFKRFFHGMLAGGIYFAPSPYEAAFVSAAHDTAAITATINRLKRLDL